MKFIQVLFLLLTVSCAAGNHSESTGQYLDSSAITAKIKGLYVRDERLSAFDVKVETYKGQVQLSGFVEKESEKTIAEKIAFSIVGVEKVINNIIVRKN